MYFRNHTSHDHVEGMGGVEGPSFVTTGFSEHTINICVRDSGALGSIQVLLLSSAKVQNGSSDSTELNIMRRHCRDDEVVLSSVIQLNQFSVSLIPTHLLRDTWLEAYCSRGEHVSDSGSLLGLGCQYV